MASLRPCQRCRWSCDHRTTGSVAERSPRYRRTTLGLGWDAAIRRPYHPSQLQNKECRSYDAAKGVVALPPRAEIKHDEKPLGGSFADVPGTTNTRGRTLAIVYTCAVCDTRSAKQFTEHAYRHGVVLVRCPGCQNLHLIADRLGWFHDAGEDSRDWDVEKAMAEAGNSVTAVAGEDVLELTQVDVIGGNA